MDCFAALAMTIFVAMTIKERHCEERSDVAIYFNGTI